MAMAGVAPGGHFVATAAPDKSKSASGIHLIGGGATNFVKKGRKKGVLHLNDPLPQTPPPPQRVQAAERPQLPVPAADDAASKKEQQIIKQVSFVLISFIFKSD